jgi:hypothetical protein
MAQTAAGLRFTLKTGQKLRFPRPPWRDHFDSDNAGGTKVGSQVDVPHAARAQVLVDSIFPVQNFADHR